MNDTTSTIISKLHHAISLLESGAVCESFRIDLREAGVKHTIQSSSLPPAGRMIRPSPIAPPIPAPDRPSLRAVPMPGIDAPSHPHPLDWRITRGMPADTGQGEVSIEAPAAEVSP